MDKYLESELREVTAYLRGTILEWTIKVERCIDDYLSIHFSRDKPTAIELKEMLLYTERITLGSKKDILFILLDKYHKDFLKNNPTFKERLDKLIPHRNIFAHYEIDLSKNLLDENELTIVFKKYKEGKLKLHEYEPDKIHSLLQDFGSILVLLHGLRAEAYKRIHLPETD